MEIFQQVLKKAEHEGMMDPRIAATMSGKKYEGWDLKKLRLPPILMNLPEDVIHDLQKIMENIHQISELKSIQVILVRFLSGLISFIRLFTSARSFNDVSPARAWMSLARFDEISR